MTNADVEQTLQSIADARTAQQAHEQALAGQWRRLRAYRDGLARELEAMVRQRLPENRQQILDDLLAAEPECNTTSVALSGANKALAQHELTTGRLARLMPSWTRQHAQLQAEVERCQAADTAAGELRSMRVEVLQRLSDTRARTNAVANQRILAPHQGVKSRLDGLDQAILALKLGDDSASACLQRWDIEALIRMGDYRRRFDAYGKIGQLEWMDYCNAGLSPPTPEFESMPGSVPGSVPGRVPGREQVTYQGLHLALVEGSGGSLSARLLDDYAGLGAGTDLATVEPRILGLLLDSLQDEGSTLDVRLLEVYLAAIAQSHAPQPRQGQDHSHPQPPPQPPRGGVPATSPYDILGVTRDTPMAEVKKTFIDQMQLLEHLPNRAPIHRLIQAFQDITAIARKAGQDQKHNPQS